MTKDDMEQHVKENEKLTDIIFTPKVLIILSGFILILALFAPMIFSKPHLFESIVFNDKTGAIGDTFGIMNPIIAIAAALITYAAFLTQYKANEAMLEENRNQRKESIKLNRKQQLVNQFYEMLKIHQENVKELKWRDKIIYEKNENNKKKSIKKFEGEVIPTKEQKFFDQIQLNNSNSMDEHEYITENGRYIFKYYLMEFNIAFNLVDILCSENDFFDKVKIAYNIFYKGYCNSCDSLNDLILKVRSSIRENGSYELFLQDLSKYLDEKGLKEKKDKIQGSLADFFRLRSFFSIQMPFCGHFEKLNHYYRHLFLMVKMVAKEDEDVFSYLEKRDLLRILRAQLSNKEQIMLFYNWYSGNGKQWEEFGDAGNHFFTRFRMIHNMTPYDLIPFQEKIPNRDKSISNFIQYFSIQINSAEEFAKHPVLNLKYAEKEYPQKNDPLFEFEDWYDDESMKFNYE